VACTNSLSVSISSVACHYCSIAVLIIRRQCCWPSSRLSGSQCCISTPWSSSARWHMGSLRSSAMKWWLKWCTDDWMGILLVICSCHVPKEMELTPWNKRRNWRTTSSLLTVALVTCLVYGIRRILHCVPKASHLLAGLFDSSKLWAHTPAPGGNIGLSAIASRWLNILSLLGSLTIILVFLHQSQTAWWNSGRYR